MGAASDPAATDTRGEEPSMLDAYAEALAKTGQLEEAIAVGKEALSLAADHERLRQHLERPLKGYQKKFGE